MLRLVEKPVSKEKKRFKEFYLKVKFNEQRSTVSDLLWARYNRVHSK